MKKIWCVSSGRADFYLMRSLFQNLSGDAHLWHELVVTGAHLTNNFGKILKDMLVPVTHKVDVLLQSDTSVSTAGAIGLGVIKFSDLMIRNKPDAVLLVGDRFEIYSAAIAAYCLNIPIIHLCGGETTHGSLDNGFRHSITAMAKYHFAAHEEYSKKIKSITDSKYVFTVGSPGIDNLKNTVFFTQNEILDKTRMDLRAYILCTYHPETNISKEENIKNMNNIFAAASRNEKYDWIFTFANQDACGREYNRMIRDFCKNNRHAMYIMNAGTALYLSLIKYSVAVLGNSSSGIIEAPYLGAITINVGNRQSGRIKADTIIDVGNSQSEIEMAIDNLEYVPRKVSEIFGEGNVAKKIISILKEIL